MTEIFSSGGGTQSAAITALIVLERIPPPDHVCIVDTERERSTTWEYMEKVIEPALLNFAIKVHRIRKSEWRAVPEHGLDYMSANGETLLLPAYTNQVDGHVGKLSGFCSDKWKVRVRQRYVREVLKIPTAEQRNWIGFSLDETRRAARMMAGDEYKEGRIRFPLIHDVPMRRQQAIELVESMGWPTPPRSACWNCPNQGDAEWQDLKANHPDEFAAACALEKEVQEHDPFAWFHKSCVPLGDVDFGEPDDPLADRACSSGGCFT